MGARAGVDGCGKPRPVGIQSPDHPARRDIAADAKVLVQAGLSPSPPCSVFKYDGLANKA